jgi:hypothetical protein
LSLCWKSFFHKLFKFHCCVPGDFSVLLKICFEGNTCKVNLCNKSKTSLIQGDIGKCGNNLSFI